MSTGGYHAKGDKHKSTLHKRGSRKGFNSKLGWVPGPQHDSVPVGKTMMCLVERVGEREVKIQCVLDDL